jgi:mannose-1-phosphate guanylyltransferase
MKAMILAAGQGNRFRPHTQKLPKPALPFLGVPMGYFSLHMLKEAGVSSLVVNTFHLPNNVQSLYRDQNLIPCEFSNETAFILGSGGGLKNAEDHFLNQEDLFLINSDEIIISSEKKVLEKLKTQHLKNRPIGTLLVTEHPLAGTKFGGVWVDENYHVIGFGKQAPAGSKFCYHFLGCQMLNKKIFSYLAPDQELNILYDGLISAIKKNEKVEILNIDCDYFETGNLSDYLIATQNVLQKIAMMSDDSIELSRTLKTFFPDHELIKTESSLLLKSSSSVLENCKLKGFVVIGPNTHLRNCQLENVIIDQGLQFDDEDFVEDLIID